MRFPSWLIVSARLWTFLFILLIVILPTLSVFKYLFEDPRALHLILDPLILDVVRATLIQALLSTTISAGIGYGLGVWMGTRFSNVTQALLLIPYCIPTLAVAVAMIICLRGTTLSYSLGAVVIAHVLINAPWIALNVAQARSQVPHAWIESARVSGGTSVQIQRSVVWPFLRWNLASTSAQVFSLCVMSFALVLILGGGPPVQTVETEIYSLIRLGTIDLAGASACAFWEIVLTLSPWVLLRFLHNSRNANLLSKSTVPYLRSKSPAHVNLIALIFLVPYSVLFFRNPDFLNLLLRPQVVAALQTTLFIALNVAILTLVTSILALSTLNRSNWMSGLVMLPSGLSILVLALGFWLTYAHWIDPFEGSALAIILLQTATIIPAAIRMLWPLTLSQQSRKLDLVATLGAGPMRAFFIVEWPRWRKSLLAVFALGVGVSVGELGAVSLFYNEKLVPAPLLLSRWMSQYRFEDAEALATLILTVSVAITFLSYGYQTLRKESM